jgi:hypothetical protein
MTYKNRILKCRKYLKISKKEIVYALDIPEKELQKYEQLET